ncbi:MAG: PDZ domain-containing protein, partial [Oscillospiraceae bacterium]
MSVKILSVDKNSPADKAGIKNGDIIISINSHKIRDVLDYKFYMTDNVLEIALESGNLTIKKGEYEDLGLEFETYLMDKQHSCKNKCIFCFVDQMPKGMRDSLYFKDDDERMSFLFGNYITLTNLYDEDIERIIKMRISPVNISVHTTNPELRVKMMANPRAAETLSYIKRLTDAGIKVNTQLVLCPDINDGEELEKSLDDLGNLYPNLQTISCVPVGLTDYREGLHKLLPYTKEQ